MEVDINGKMGLKVMVVVGQGQTRNWVFLPAIRNKNEVEVIDQGHPIRGSTDITDL